MYKYNPFTGNLDNVGRLSPTQGVDDPLVTERFEAIQDQTLFVLQNIRINSNTIVLLNGDDVSPADYSGNGTKNLTFNNGLLAADKITVIGNEF